MSAPGARPMTIGAGNGQTHALERARALFNVERPGLRLLVLAADEANPRLHHEEQEEVEHGDEQQAASPGEEDRPC